jgi:hypothetical protein
MHPAHFRFWLRQPNHRRRQRRALGRAARDPLTAMARPVIELGTLTRCMIAIGCKRHHLERRHGRGAARYVALNPESLDQILQLGELHFQDNSRSFVELIGLEFVADDSLTRGYVEVRPAHQSDASA